MSIAEREIEHRRNQRPPPPAWARLPPPPPPTCPPPPEPMTLSEAIQKGLINPYECEPPDDRTETINRPDEVVSIQRFPLTKHFSLGEFCEEWEKFLRLLEIKHVKFHCDESNYIILELTEDIVFSLKSTFTNLLPIERNVVNEVDKTVTTQTRTMLRYYAEVLNEWFGFQQDKFKLKGKYYSIRPLRFYRTDLFLRCNLVDRKNILYNNKQSNILCVFPVDDGSQVKHQRYEPSNCTRVVNKATNHLKFEVTDENGKVVNFRGTPFVMHFTLETFPIINGDE